MHLFSPDRPESSPGCPAILIDGNAMPQFVVRPKANGLVGISVMLRDYGTSAAYSYSYRHIEVPSSTLGVFMDRFAEDPEEVFAFFFNWTPQAGKPASRPATHRLWDEDRPIPPAPAGAIDMSEDLL